MEKNEAKLVEYADKASITSSFTNPRKAWKELLDSINNIYINFKKSQIDPEELHILLSEESNSTGIPTIGSIEKIINVMNRYIKDYKISNATTLFLEFKRLAAVYLFSIGSEKSMDYLKEILHTVEDVIGLENGENMDINMVCIKDCVKLNMAIINFWLEKFDEAKDLLGDVITTYEVMDNELYLIKMVNFVSVAFTYLAWIYTKQKHLDDAEKAFLHAIKVIKIVKKHTKLNRREEGFINVKAKKVFIFDQLMNFYALVEKFENCQQPLNEILKIMDKPSFMYDIDITPSHHANYYITATLHTLKTNNKVDLEKALHYLSNVVKIIYKFSSEMESIPPVFYDNFFALVSCVKLNGGRPIFFRQIKTDREDNRISECDEYEDELMEYDLKTREIIIFELDKVSIYLDEVIGKFDSEKQFSLNLSGSNSIMDLLVNLDKYTDYIKNNKFSQFNFLNEILEKQCEENLTQQFDIHEVVEEIHLLKLTTERMLFTYANIVKSLNDCKTIGEKIIMEGLNGFLVIENDEVILYSIYRFMARDDYHALHSKVKFHLEDDVREKRYKGAERKYETLKVFKIKNLENDFAPLYYKRITFRLEKDAKTFNFPIYFAMINLLYSKQLYHPCTVLISLFVDEISSMAPDLYDQEGESQKVNSFLHLYEFLLFLQAYIFIVLKQFDRALYELLNIQSNVNEFNELLYKTLLGICLTHRYYFDIALMNFSDGIHLIKSLVEEYTLPDETDPFQKELSTPNTNKLKDKTPEIYLTEIRMFMSFLKCFTYETLNIIYENRSRYCYRCDIEDNSINAICLNCDSAVYCNKKCMKKNFRLHVNLCRFYKENKQLIANYMERLEESYRSYKDQMYRVEYRRNKDKVLLP